jgi:hypothetical protein
MIKYTLILIFLGLISSGGYAQASKNAAHTVNHPYAKVEIGYLSDGCSFQFSPLDFCDERHLASIKKAIRDLKPNFNQHYILLSIPEWEKKFHQQSLVAIDVLSGIVYPLPIDGYSGSINKKGEANEYGKLISSLNSSKICIEGVIYGYKTQESGKFYFTFLRNKFVGHQTTYMYE